MKVSFNSIPKFCISLKRSKERRDMVQKEFKKHDLDVKFFDAVDRNDVIVPELCVIDKKSEVFPHTPGIYACMLSHLELYKKAAELKLPAICVFEDDVILASDFNKRMEFIDSIKNFEYDFFSLGGHMDREQMSNAVDYFGINHIFRNKSVSGSYGYIITDKVYNYCIRNLTYNFGMDQFLSDIVYKNFACYSFIPYLVGCRPGKSEITNAVGEYLNIKHHFQQEPLTDIDEPYVNPFEIENEINRQKIDEYRENALKND